MNEALQFLHRHGYAVLFAFVLAEQFGLPLPAAPILLAMGALAGVGQFSFATALVVATTASLISDLFWYGLGRRRGHSVLTLLCSISLEPDSCVRRTQNMFSRSGAGALLFAKIVPGLSAVAPPLAGIIRMPLWRFAVCDSAGALLWSGLFMGTGYVFRSELQRVAEHALRMGGWLVVVLASSLVAYIAWKLIERQRFMRRLRIARVTPEELMEKLQAGEDVIIVDLRQSIALQGEGLKLPRALQMLPEELDDRHQEIPRDRDVVLYCT